ncbi:hypothetical protein GCM10009837_87480 [Streptomyces durmitorensis]|uniref:Nuclear transport factor 2 family protein n=1 Tax=Streptomyces durmitorensis TaxID=319947 RepID=A0ABY4QAH2_9ACTN|nr:nuclear transport factor 2 family protein [Streptomyces durmitorensis]UQT61993.1 nuclear transport factor 2 family protein [Streptomyces durmitorensis]
MSAPNTVSAVDVEAWVAALESGWRGRDVERIVALFTEDAWYRQGPFGEAHLGQEAIRKHWTGTLSRQRDPEIWFAEPVVAGDRTALEWWCVLHDPDTGAPRTAAGCLFLSFAPDGRCRGLHEYWHARTDAGCEPHATWPRRSTRKES